MTRNDSIFAPPRLKGGGKITLEEAGRRWRESADELGEFFRTHGCWPRQFSKAWPTTEEADTERRLALFRLTQVAGKRNGGKGYTEARGAYLDEVAPGWGPVDLDGPWLEIVKEIVAFATTTGYWPVAGKKASGEREVWLALWLMRQRAGRSMTDERASRLDEFLPGWASHRSGDRFTPSR